MYECIIIITLYLDVIVNKYCFPQLEVHAPFVNKCCFTQLEVHAP